MKDILRTDDCRSIFAEASRVMTENFQLLTDLDAVAGDGDLGVTMTKGFAAAAAAAQACAENDVGRILMMAGLAIAREAPSTLGTLLASGFLKGAKEVMGKESLDLEDTARFLEGFTRGIMERGKCKPGDKTIVDALLPAVESLHASTPGTPLADAWRAAVQAAEAGKVSTTQMKAQHGRAAYRGENSIGSVDPGATVAVLLVKVIAERTT